MAGENPSPEEQGLPWVLQSFSGLEIVWIEGTCPKEQGSGPREQ